LKIIFLNGELIPEREAKIFILEPGFLYAWGLFETMRSYKKKIVYLDEHLKRIQASSKLIGIKFPYSVHKLKKKIQEIVRINSLIDAYVRLTIWKAQRGSDTLIIARKYTPYAGQKYKKGFCAWISRFRQSENSYFARMKTTNYLFCQLSFQEAKKKGLDEAIILNNRGFITEASRSNIFLVKDKEVFTPSLECGCLDGITRKVIFDLAKKYNLKIYEGNFCIQDLLTADEAFLTNSLMGVMPLVALEKKPIGKGMRGKITEFFIKKYNFLLRDKKLN